MTQVCESQLVSSADTFSLKRCFPFVERQAREQFMSHWTDEEGDEEGEEEGEEEEAGDERGKVRKVEDKRNCKEV